MKLTKTAIEKNLKGIPGLEGYRVLIVEIEKNLIINPDISIEACKSLIEGLSLLAMSLLSTKYSSNKSYRNKCKKNLTFLVEEVFEEVYSELFESIIHRNLTELLLAASAKKRVEVSALKKVQKQISETVKKISAIRNERGDISHGKVYPKNKESHFNFAKSIESITDGICSFMIYELSEQYFSKLAEDAKLNFTDLMNFNEWLNEKHRVLSIKVDYSKLLFENSYDKYEEFYYSEYIDSPDYKLEEELEQEGRIIGASLEAKNGPYHEKPKTQEVFDKISKKLVNTFNEDFFASQAVEVQTRAFAKEKDLKVIEFRILINNVLFSEKKPLRDEVAGVMNEKPPLKDRAKIISKLTNEIFDLVSDLKRLAENK